MTTTERTRFLIFVPFILLLSPMLMGVAVLRRMREDGIRTKKPRILVVPIFSRVGDLVCATPVFREIKRAYPESFLAVVAAKYTMGIVAANPRINELINYNAIPFKGLRGRLNFFLHLFRMRFDAVVSLGNSPSGTLMAIAAAAPLRIKTTVPCRAFFQIVTDWLMTHRFRYTPGSFLQTHYLRLLAPIGIQATVPVKEVFTRPPSDILVQEFFTRVFGALPPFLVGITVSAGNKIKEWPLDRFAAVGDALVERYGAQILFIDSPANHARVSEVMRLMRRKEAAVAATSFSLEDLPSLIKTLSLFIAVDTGAIYIAHALGCPLIDIIGPVHPGEQPPADERSIQVLPHNGIPPSSFVLTPPLRGAFHARAVLSITTEAVLDAVSLLRQRGIV